MIPEAHPLFRDFVHRKRRYLHPNLMMHPGCPLALQARMQQTNVFRSYRITCVPSILESTCQQTNDYLPF